MKYVGKTRYSHMDLILNEGKSIWSIGLCRNLTKSIKQNMLAALDSGLSGEYNYSVLNNWGVVFGKGKVIPTDLLLFIWHSIFIHVFNTDVIQH